MIGHILRHGSLLNTIIEGNVRSGRPRAEYMIQIIKDKNKGNYKDLEKLSYNRKRCELQ